jgi:hypothetical protein
MARSTISSRHRHANNANTLLFNRMEGIRSHIRVNNISIHYDFAMCSGKAVFWSQKLLFLVVLVSIFRENFREKWARGPLEGRIRRVTPLAGDHVARLCLWRMLGGTLAWIPPRNVNAACTFKCTCIDCVHVLCRSMAMQKKRKKSPRRSAKSNKSSDVCSRAQVVNSEEKN